MIIKIMRQKLTDLRTVKDIKILMILMRELLTNLLQMLRDAILNADFLHTILSI